MHSSFNRWKDTIIEEDHFLELKDAGVETLDVALDAQRRRAQAEQAFYNALCEYNKIIAVIHRRKGTILAYNGISFEEGLWPGKAYLDAEENARRRGASHQLNYGWSRPNVISRGTDQPSNMNNGTSGNLISAPVIHDEGVVYPEGEVIDAQPLLDATMPIEGQYIDGPIMDGLPVEGPAIMPVPTQGSSSRVMRDQSVRQVSYAQPVLDPAPAETHTSSRTTRTIAI